MRDAQPEPHQRGGLEAGLRLEQERPPAQKRLAVQGGEGRLHEAEELVEGAPGEAEERQRGEVGQRELALDPPALEQQRHVVQLGLGSGFVRPSAR